MTIICIDSASEILLIWWKEYAAAAPSCIMFLLFQRKYDEIFVFLGTLLFSDSGEVKSHSKFGISNYENDIDTQWNIKYVSFLTADEPF